MPTLWLLVKRALAQAPFQAVSIAALSALLAGLIGVGVLNAAQFPAAFEARLDDLHTADSVIQPGEAHLVEAAKAELDEDPRVTAVEVEPMHAFSAELLSVDARDERGSTQHTFEANVYLFDRSTEVAEQSMAIRAEAGERFADGAYLPQQAYDAQGYRLGDRVEVTTSVGRFTFRVQGFFERPFLSSNSFGLYGIAMSADIYASWAAEHPELPAQSMLEVHLEDPEDADEVVADLQEALSALPSFDPIEFSRFDRDLYAQVSTMPAMITAMLLLAFVVIISLAVTVLLAYLCGQRLRRDLAGIGILKAIGYSGARIRAALLTTFLGLALLGTAAGTLASYLIVPAMAQDYAVRTGFAWQPTFSAPALVVSVLVVVGSTAIAILLGTRKALRYPPVVALRGATAVHVFTRNPLPLDRARGPLGWLLAAKTALQNQRQLLGVALVVMLFSFASVFAVAMMNAATNHQRLFKDVISGGVENIRVTLDVTTDAERTTLLAELLTFEGVESAVPSIEVGVNDGTTGSRLFTTVLTDPDAPRYDPITEGRLPLHDNEIAVGTRYASNAGIRVGDEVDFEYAGEQRSLLVTGIIQGTRSLGMIAVMSEDALRGFDDEAFVNAIAVYLDEDAEAGALVRKIESELSDHVRAVYNVDAEIDAEAGTFISLVVSFAQAVLVITAIVVALVLWLMVSTLLAERRRSLGMLRALGHTWPQLAWQIVLSYLPVLAGSAVIGALCGAFGFNPVIALMLSDLGLSNPDFPVETIQVTAVGGVLVVFSAALLLALTAQVQRIAPTELLKE